MTREEVLADLPGLTAEDIGRPLRYAAEAVQERELPAQPAGLSFLQKWQRSAGRPSVASSTLIGDEHR